MALPLEDVKVLDFTRVMAGPFATMLLGDLGADVIKIEPPGGDDTRSWGPPWIGRDSAYFMSTNRNKRSIIIDLKNPRSREVVERLVKRADVVLENFRPGVAEELGISYDKLSRINPRIIYCSISGFGQSGPYRDRPGYDLVALAMSGLMSITGEANRPPVKFGVPIADLTTALFAVISILSALYWREKTGKGQYIDMAILDVQILLLSHQAFNYFATGEEPKRMGSAHPNIVPYQAFETSDGYIVITVGSEKLWEKFCRAVERTDFLDNPKFRTNADRVVNREELVEELSRMFRSKPTSFWLEVLEKAGVPAAPVLTVGQALNNEHVRYRGMVVEIEHQEAGLIKMLGTPFKLSETPGRVRAPPPIRGQHTYEILKELGFTDEEIRELMDARIVE